MKNAFLIFIAVFLVVVIALLVWTDQLRPAVNSVPAAETGLGEDVLAENPIEELEGIDLEGLEDEFQEIDADLENL